MEHIIKKAIEGGFDPSYWNMAEKAPRDLNGLEISRIVLDPLFWQALAEYQRKVKGLNIKPDISGWIDIATHFHFLNLTEGWSKACEYLEEVTK